MPPKDREKLKVIRIITVQGQQIDVFSLTPELFIRDFDDCDDAPTLIKHTIINDAGVPSQFRIWSQHIVSCFVVETTKTVVVNDPPIMVVQ